jgi:hypothetical protein
MGEGKCGGCGKRIFYNLAAQHLEHEVPNPDCPYPWVKVERTPEEGARIAAAEAANVAEQLAYRERHAWMLDNVADPILRALIEAHRPDRDGLWADCPECPRPPSEIDGDDVPEAWPCPVWRFISDRLESP